MIPFERWAGLALLSFAYMAGGCSSQPATDAAVDTGTPTTDTGTPTTDTGTPTTDTGTPTTDTGTPTTDTGTPVADAGAVHCGEARGGATPGGCAAATPMLEGATCRCTLGWIWNGRTCNPSNNCSCLAGCDQVYPSERACLGAYASCLDGGSPPVDAGTAVHCGEARGGATPGGCAAATPMLEGATCRCTLGWIWDGRTCNPSNNCSCLAGCDQVFPTEEGCQRAYATCLTDAGLPSVDGGLRCGEAAGGATLRDCAPATPSLEANRCRCILGYLWDGSACTGVSNCSCLSGCDQLYPTMEACSTAYARCLGDGGR